jgi:hypothetical protein
MQEENETESTKTKGDKEMIKYASACFRIYKCALKYQTRLFNNTIPEQKIMDCAHYIGPKLKCIRGKASWI